MNKLRHKSSETNIQELKHQLDALETQVGTSTGGAKVPEPPPIRPTQTLPSTSRVNKDVRAQELPVSKGGTTDAGHKALPASRYPKPDQRVSRPQANSICLRCHVNYGNASRLVDHNHFAKYRCSFTGLCYEYPHVHHDKYKHTSCEECKVCEYSSGGPNDAIKKHECPPIVHQPRPVSPFPYSIAQHNARSAR